MFDVVGAPERRKLAVEISAFVGEFRRAEPVNGIRTGLLTDRLELLADLPDRLVPGDPRPLAIDQLERMFEPAVTMHQLAHRGALGAMRSAADRGIPARLLSDPDAVLDHADHRAADRAMGADVLTQLDRCAGRRRRTRRCLTHASERQGSERRKRTREETGATQERAAVKPVRCLRQRGGNEPAATSRLLRPLDKHLPPTLMTDSPRNTF